ncbi:MAG: peptidylprolyl isomerase [Spirochaetales bacterium]
MNVEKDRVVSISYTLKDQSGNVLDSSGDNGNFEYLHGHQNIVPGLEIALEGKSSGDSIDTVVEPSEAYGERNDQLVFQVPKDKMPDEELAVGTQFAAQDKEGNQQIVTLIDVGDASVTLDANHPLAGEILHFNVTVNEVRDASKEEIEHGHVHSEGDHQH